jgi:ABC-type lipoprotein release transport system permease subunit
VAIQSDDKIIVTGFSNAPGTYDFYAARLLTNGTLDTIFDTDGVASVAIGAVLLAILVALIPARKASRMNPVTALSFE